MKTRVLAFIAMGVFLAGCAGAVVEDPPVAEAVTRTAVPSATAPVVASPTEAASGGMETQVDEQGAVIFEVTPLNLGAPGDTLEFQVVMNTHSVDLSWDLAAQSVLQTDTGLEVRGLVWPIGNGHHYGGTLTFPVQTEAGQALLDNATAVTLIIRDTDVAERVFTWELAR
ncbi:MAG TPA: hypothetical protein VFI11_01620 [Anaerolineales bacterium]|nr:hypothetical protein [Anaerolineales bacterium]